MMTRTDKRRGWGISVCLSLFLLLTSCSSIRFVGIETLEPSALTIPCAVRRVLIVDNAAMQPTIPCALTLGKIPLEATEVTTDSMAFYYCHTLGQRIADAHRYDDVRLYDKAYRPAHLSDQPLSASEVRQLCTDEGVDAVISLDRLLFNVKGDVNPLYFLTTNPFRVEVTGTLRLSIPSDTLPTVRVVHLSDTLRAAFEGTINGAEAIRQAIRTALYEVSLYMAEKSSLQFVPHWESNVRWYYTASSSAWKEADAYAAAEKWKEASAIWHRLYEQATNWKVKARLASNIAVSEEFSGNLSLASDWADRSYAHYLEHSSATDPTTLDRQRRYAAAMKQRLLSDSELKKLAE